MANFDLANLALKMVCPTNEIIVDDKGLPSVYVQKAPQTLNNLLNTDDTSIHPAFIVNGQQVNRLLIGKFDSIVHQNRTYSIPGDPSTVDYDFDDFEKYCKQKGNGHHCLTAAERAFIILLAKKNGIIVKGNNNYGKDISESSYIAIPTYSDDGIRTCRVANGTGPVSWSDTNGIDGIFDLNANISEWCSGVRIFKSELQVIPYNDAAMFDIKTSSTSSAWRAINANATGWDDLYIIPNSSTFSENSVKYDFINSHWVLQQSSPKDEKNYSRNGIFRNTTIANDVSDFAALYLKAMCLAPDINSNNYYGDAYYHVINGKTAKTRYMRFGGGYSSGSGAGLFALNFADDNYAKNQVFGSRTAYYD